MSSNLTASAVKYLGIDYGAKRIGIALSDERGSFAFPRETIPNDVSAIDRILALVRTEEVAVVVMGDTQALNGVDNPITEKAEYFAQALSTHLAQPIVRVREGWSSVEAGRYAPKGKQHDDASAAAIILQRHLDTVSKPLPDTDMI